MQPNRIFLVGLSGSGKSSVGDRVAGLLGWRFVDADREIEKRTARTIPDIFANDGEAAFRSLEGAELRRCLDLEDVVVATGGGAVTTSEGRAALAEGFSVWLSVSPKVAAERLAANPATEDRPLLHGASLTRLETLLASRSELYAQADAAIDVDSMTVDQVAAEVVHLWDEERGAQSTRRDVLDGARLDRGYDEHVAAVVRTPLTSYPVVVADGAIEWLGGICRSQGLKGRAFILTDIDVGPRYESPVAAALAAEGYTTETYRIPSGEAEKTLATVSLVYDWLIEARAERGDFLVCLGGGVVTDLGGFAAATYLRGVPFVHVPTTLLGMVDASVGGKTGVDHPRAKNMVGAFAQPSAVVIDPSLLDTLPERQLRAGWAEVVKHGLILDAQLFADLEAVAGDPGAMRSAELIGRSVAIKAAVVSEDEREADRRSLLNYGHTIGHAIEAVTGYESYLHGEAVAIGMHAAGLISVEMGMLSQAELERQQRVLEACGLPPKASGVSIDAVLDATLRDKKVSGGKIRWALLERIGHAALRSDVPPEVVRRAAEAVLS